MSPPTTSAASITSNVGLLVSAVAIAQGLQLLRGLLASFSVYLNQIRDLDAVTLSGLVLLVFLAGLAAPMVRRLFGARRAVLVLATSLSLLRVAEQVVGTADARLIVEVLGVVAWLWLLLLVTITSWSPATPGHRSSGALSIVLGLAIDTAISGAFDTLDPALSTRTVPAVTTVAIVCAQLVMVGWLARQPGGEAEPNAPPMSAACIGPVLVLEMLLFQNLARLTVLTEWSLPAAFAVTMLANIITIWVALAWSRDRSRANVWTLVAAGGVLVLCGLAIEDAIPAVLTAIVGPVAAAVLLSSAFAPAHHNQSSTSWFGPAIALLIIPLGLLGWYARYEIDVPIPQWTITLIVAVLAILPVVLHAAKPRTDSPANDTQSQQQQRSLSKLNTPRAVPFLAPTLLLLLPLYVALSWSTPDLAPDDSGEIRAITYNIHQGFDVHGMPTLDEIVDVLESERPDIIALQEVPRGWLVNGATDTLSWLSQRLDMHSAWGPATDRFWGNAILSRYPLTDVKHWYMPNNDELRLNRSVLMATIDVHGQPVQVVATHLHHVGREPHYRLVQVQALLDTVDWNRPSILLGDLNAQPHHAELQRLSRAGIDIHRAELGVPVSVPTYPAERPRRQIDFVLSTEHFETLEHRAIQTTASDHLPLLAVLGGR